MKRFSPEHIHEVAREFATTHVAEAWHMFGSEIQAAIIDAHVMRQIRMAHVADSTQTWTPTEIVEFRDGVAAALAEGVVPAHTRKMKMRFRVEE